jgi:hypothetical protein
MAAGETVGYATQSKTQVKEPFTRLVTRMAGL